MLFTSALTEERRKVEDHAVPLSDGELEDHAVSLSDGGSEDHAVPLSDGGSEDHTCLCQMEDQTCLPFPLLSCVSLNEKYPQGFMHLNTGPLVAVTVWRGYRTYKRYGLAGGGGCASRVDSLPTSCSISLIPVCVQKTSIPLPAPPAAMLCLPLSHDGRLVL